MRESTRQSRTSGAKDKAGFERAFGQVLHDVRSERKISQEQLGFEAGYHRTYISLIERGLKKPSLKAGVPTGADARCSGFRVGAHAGS